MKTGIKPITGIVNTVGDLVERVTLPAREKKQLETDLLRAIIEWEQRVTDDRSAILAEEVRGNWLQRSWRPLVMLTFVVIILVGAFTSLPILADTSRFWDLLEVGLGGYVVGRSGEKIVGTIFKLKAKR